MRKDTQQQFHWSGSIEHLEDRVVMSADPLGGLLGGPLQHHSFVDDLPAVNQHVIAEQPPALDHHTESLPDFWISSEDQLALEDELRQIDQQLANAHDQSGLTQVRNNYGFTGIGQTVAVIDSGIAYDHYALGGGFGQDYRVVGGYDFTGENDADPYDDGPSGSHGTHVSGIIGGDAGSHNGVAPGVDLVGLRVFDDAGAGYFSWVENALSWVHTNRNNFENPITAVNLSLGVATWNSDTIPSWANLEDEFAQLEADGIFISVSAGNSYTSFNQTGLSYPAASQYVVPVASVDDSGLLSYFSQRNSRVIAAPGRGITSTVPDYKGNNNGVTDDYASFSGTSMAAPYVAGASVIIREAMEFAGYTNITQDMIYDHMVATADSFFDSATSQYYNRLNLDSAINALMPTDDFGSTEATGYNLGTISTSMSMNGAITTLNDVDYFNFTAEGTGTVTFEVSNTTHELTSSWISSSAQSLSTLSATGDSITLNVIAGQSYSVGYASGDGLGYYDLDISAESTFSPVDWGTISSSQFNNISISGEAWYRVEANSDGYFTVGSQFDSAGNQINMELYNSNMELIDSGTASNGTSRVDTYAAAGEELFLKVLGTNTDVDFQLTNLVSVDGTTVTVTGTAGDDTFAFNAGSTHQVTVNGVTYDFASIAISSINFSGNGGNDSVTLTGTSGNETAELRYGNIDFSGAGFTVSVLEVEDATVYGGGGDDRANFYDTAGDDHYVGKQNFSKMTGTGYSHVGYNFNTTYAYSSVGGVDTAELYDTAGDDHFRGKPSASFFMSTDYFQFASNFEYVYAYSLAGGTDTAELYDSPENDLLVSRHDQTFLRNATTQNLVLGFDYVYAYSIYGGEDSAHMFDSSGDDVFVGTSTHSVYRGTGFYNYARGFDIVKAYADNGGADSSVVLGTAAEDSLYVLSDSSWFYGAGYQISVQSFSSSKFLGLGGDDTANYFDLSDEDEISGNSNLSSITRGDSVFDSYDFAFVYAQSLAGQTPSVDNTDIDYAFELLGT